MLNVEFSEAATEVLDILKNTEKTVVNKISNKFIKFLEENQSKTYISNLDHSKTLKEMELKPKTKAILGYIYREYICNENQKIEYDKRLLENEKIYQEKLREKYNNDIFKNNNEKIKEITVSKEKWCNKFIKFINKIFNKDK